MLSTEPRCAKPRFSGFKPFWGCETRPVSLRAPLALGVLQPHLSHVRNHRGELNFCNIVIKTIFAKTFRRWDSAFCYDVFVV
jgi:hypothetical protein